MQCWMLYAEAESPPWPNLVSLAVEDFEIARLCEFVASRYANVYPLSSVDTFWVIDEEDRDWINERL